ncbi:MAG: lipocalin family protein [Gemmatimonadales bacterium]
MTPRLLAVVVLSIGLLGCGESPTQPTPTLVGVWELVGYSDAGTPAATTGTAEFRLDGTFGVSGTLTFPGEPPDPVATSGTYEVEEDQVELTTLDGSGLWTLGFAGQEVSLTLEGSAPPTSMTLRRLA